MVCPGLVQAAQGVPSTRCSLCSLGRTRAYSPLEKEVMDIMSQDSHFLLYFCMALFKINVSDRHELVWTTACALPEEEASNHLPSLVLFSPCPGGSLPPHSLCLTAACRHFRLEFSP